MLLSRYSCLKSNTDALVSSSMKLNTDALVSSSMKLNTDALVSLGVRFCIGDLVQDHLGSAIFFWSIRIPGICSAEVGELLAIKISLYLASIYSASIIVIELDALNAINALKSFINFIYCRFYYC
ncbi:hypothetical protein PanWU01x14_175430 [Parasponia andersonii]|uniref:RNase H type-1 domain-containing protein n=1 Tax=Parasponia andersonii TaxID=3476 RepID=A0A2P5C8B1_PARAD|nr:hypothetical protein PanWU01x14_175430 [Parasponia andersonii]